MISQQVFLEHADEGLGYILPCPPTLGRKNKNSRFQETDHLNRQKKPNSPRSFFSCIAPLRSLADAAMPDSCSNDFPNLLEKTQPSR